MMEEEAAHKEEDAIQSANIPEVAGGTDGVEGDYPPRAPHPHFRQIIRESESTSGRGSRQQSPSAASTELSDEQAPQALTPMSPQQVVEDHEEGEEEEEEVIYAQLRPSTNPSSLQQHSAGGPAAHLRNPSSDLHHHHHLSVQHNDMLDQMSTVSTALTNHLGQTDRDTHTVTLSSLTMD